ncbi:coiled-coil domain-containing protein 180 [Myripristis murdjan]|uniref:coiled-coil domain-containing protein 180 n=1 Tax=Myripristis murdjan TaxID=586833 RepID=UPI0011760F9E|nr:coiled-coil domain-containing protein 180 [Myripristis murdjan]
MWRSREARSGQVYRQLFEAQVQLSRSLLARRGRLNTACLSAACLSAEDSNTTSRLQVCGSASRGRQEEQDVSALPDAVVSDRPRSDIIERLTEKKQREQSDALERLYTDLTVLTEGYEAQYRTSCVELLSSLGVVDLRLDSLRDRMEQVEQFSQQEVCALWEEVLEEVKLRRSRIHQLDRTLTEYESERSSMVSVILRKYCHLLGNISFSPPADLYRLIHSVAMMINQSVLANRRSAAHLLLRLLEENLEKESLLRLRWEDCLSCWRSSRASQVIDGFRRFSSSWQGSAPAAHLQKVLDLRRTQQRLAEERCDIIRNLSSLAPPTCSSALVSDWYNRLTAVNHKIDELHVDSVRQLRCCYEQLWQDGLAEVERCREALRALKLSEDEVHRLISSQLLPLIGRCQSQAEARLAALDDGFESLARCANTLSCRVFVLLRGAALLWETHSVAVETREEELQQQVDRLRHTQEQERQRRRQRVDVLLDGMRQESSEEALRLSLQSTSCFLSDSTASCRQGAAALGDVLDRFPALLLDELHSYSRRLSSHFSIHTDYGLTPQELQSLYPSIKLELTEKQHQTSEESETDSAHSAQEQPSEVVDLWDFGSLVTFTSHRGGAFSGHAFRCPSPAPLAGLEEETKLALFPVELLTHTLTQVRELFFLHLEQHLHDALSSSVAMVTERKEVLRSEQELQLQLLDAQHIQTHIHNPRQAELVQHRQCVEAHCQGVLDVLSGCRAELQQLQAAVSRGSQELTSRASHLEEAVLHSSTLHRLQCVYSTLQDSLDRHIEETQQNQTALRQSVQLRMQQLRDDTAALLRSFKLFSEGGDFAPQEVEVFQRRLEEKMKKIDETEEAIQTELDASESRSLQQVKEAFARFEEKFSLLRVELTFLDKIQKVLSNTQVHIKAEAASSNQQQRVVSSKVEELRKLMELTEVSSDQVCSLLSSLSQVVRTRCLYLDCFLDSSLALPVPQRPLQGSFALAARPKPRRKERLAPPPGLLQPCRVGVVFCDDAAVGVVKALNRFSRMQPGAAETEQRRTTTGQSSSPLPLQNRSAESVSGQSVRKLRTNRTDKRLQRFGSKPEPGHNSFRSRVNSLLWKASDVLLLVAEGFYKSERRGGCRFHFVSDSLDQWAESLNQRLLGYQEQARQYQSNSIQEFVDQLCVLEKLLCSLPGVLCCNHEQRQGAELMEEVGGVRQRLEKTLEASEEEKRQHVARLRLALDQQQLEALSSSERRRQQELHDAISRSHRELQERVRVRGEEFVTSLASLTESLLLQLDGLLTPAELTAASDQSERFLVTAETGQQPCSSSRTWPGIPFLLFPDDITAATASPVTMATTTSITTAKCTLGHLAVIEQRDAAVKRYEQLYRSEVLRSDADRRRQQAALQSWNTHWDLQMHTLTHTHTL